MKRILYSIGVICLMTITSCQTTVSDYKTEIEDAVRFYLSSVELMAHHILEEGDEALFDELLADFSSTSEETDFKSLINLSKNTTRKHCNIIFSHSHTKDTQYCLNSKKILWKENVVLVREVNKINL